MELELGMTKVKCTMDISQEEYQNCGIITAINGPEIVVKSDGGYYLHIIPVNSIDEVGVWKSSHDEKELIGMRAEFIGTHGIRLKDGELLIPYGKTFNIRDALGLDD